MARPGIMLYFDMLEPVRVLPDAEKGRLLVAMLEYGQFGKVPEFQGMLALAWAFVKPKLDRDGQSYDNAKLQRKYAAFCRQRAARELPKIPFQQWLDEGQRHETGDDEPERPVDARYPATAATETTASDTASDTASAAAAAEGDAAGGVPPRAIRYALHPTNGCPAPLDPELRTDPWLSLWESCQRS